MTRPNNEKTRLYNFCLYISLRQLDDRNRAAAYDICSYPSRAVATRTNLQQVILCNQPDGLPGLEMPVASPLADSDEPSSIVKRATLGVKMSRMGLHGSMSNAP